MFAVGLDVGLDGISFSFIVNPPKSLWLYVTQNLKPKENHEEGLPCIIEHMYIAVCICLNKRWSK